MRHDVVLVQSRVPVTSNVVQADLDVEDEEELRGGSGMELVAGRRGHTELFLSRRSHGTADVMSESYWALQLDIVLSPWTALARLAARRLMVVRNFILTVCL
jgi:hypothetical protein